MLVLYGVVLAILVLAAVCDWRARRSGRPVRASKEYWEAVHEARRAVRTRRLGPG